MTKLDYSEHVGWWVASVGDRFVARARTATELVELITLGGPLTETIVFVERAEGKK